MNFETTFLQTASQYQFEVKSNVSETSPTSFGIEFTFSEYANALFVLAPGAIYDGNRLKSLSMGYPPKFPSECLSVKPETIISDVKRLSVDARAFSNIEALSSDFECH